MGNSRAWEKSLKLYAVQYEQQKKLLDQKVDFELLCRGLQLLPNLRRITRLDKFTDSLDYMPHLWDDNEFD